MEGSSRTQAPFRSDLSLILRVIFGIAAVAGGIDGFRRRISQLCPVMATGAPLDWIPVLIVMIPT